MRQQRDIASVKGVILRPSYRTNTIEGFSFGSEPACNMTSRTITLLNIQIFHWRDCLSA